MGLMSWLKLEPQDVIAYLAAAITGYFIGTFIPEESWAVYISILVSYHMFLAWLVFTAEQKTGFSLPIVSTIVTHLACLAVIMTLGIGRNTIPFFSVFRYGIAAMAIFERGWLFSGSTPRAEAEKPGQQQRPEFGGVVASAEDHDAFLKHLATRKPDPRTLRQPLKVQYEEWLLEQRKPAGRRR